MKRIYGFLLFLVLFVFVFSTKTFSQTAYAEYENNTLTFKYGTKPNTTTSWNIPNVGGTLGWENYSGSITRVVFDSSFSLARPKTCYTWFKDFISLTQIENIGNLNTSETTNMWGMFYNCERLTNLNLSSLATYNVTDMGYMFFGCQKLTTLNISNFNTREVTNMNSMFANCTKLSSIIKGELFSTLNVTDMGEMFSCCSSMKDIDVSNFNTTKVENMNGMFSACTSLFRIDLASFNTSKVTDMSDMFFYCNQLKRIDIHNFNTSKLSATNRMFADCSSLEKIICDGDWSGVSESTNMFKGCTNLAGAISYNSSKVTAAYANKTTGYFSHFYYYIAEVSNDHNTLTFRRSETAPNGTTQWDATKSGYEEIDTNPDPDDDYYQPNYTFHGLGVKKVVFDESFNDARPNSCYSWFNYNTSLTEIVGIENLNTSEVTNMAYMFYNCSNLKTIDLRSFDVTFVNNMMYMFNNCSNLETIACDDNWYSDNVSDSYMFSGCTHLNGAIAYHYSKTDIKYANPTTGYFTSTANYKVDLTVPSYGICTYSSTYDLDFTNVEGLTAYVISSFNAGEGTLTLTPATKVKAGEGLLLKGNAGEYVVPRTTTDVTYTNYLVGVPTTTSISPSDGDYTNFVLANGTHGVNFYALSKTGNISAGKAYLKLPTADINKSNLSRGFVIDNNGTTLISTPIRNEYDDMLYDLQGRRVNKPSKGLYIMNGKKVIIK